VHASVASDLRGAAAFTFALVYLSKRMHFKKSARALSELAMYVDAAVVWLLF
jgi:hypothetical protein